MNSLDKVLADRLAELESSGLLRRLRMVESPQCARIRIEGREVLNFSSNDYLGLANSTSLKEAACRAVADYGAGSGASRLICGSLKIHHQVEDAIAAFKNSQAALTFSSGYATALGTITALMGKDDIIILDKLVHASIIDAARLSGAKLRIFSHNDLTELEDILRWASNQRAGGTRNEILVVVESVYSMDGDSAPLSEIVRLKEQYGAWLMVDEAHATGMFGARRSGLVEHENLGNKVEVQMGTLGKAIGAAGGYIAGSRRLIDWLINRARSFVFSTAPPPAQSGAALAGIELIQSSTGEKLLKRLRDNIAGFQGSFARSQTAEIATAIFPLIIGGEEEAMRISSSLLEAGIFVPAIRYPTVPKGTARLRVTLTAAHEAADITRLTAALGEMLA